MRLQPFTSNRIVRCWENCHVLQTIICFTIYWIKFTNLFNLITKEFNPNSTFTTTSWENIQNIPTSPKSTTLKINT